MPLFPVLQSAKGKSRHPPAQIHPHHCMCRTNEHRPRPYIFGPRTPRGLSELSNWPNSIPPESVPGRKKKAERQLDRNERRFSRRRKRGPNTLPLTRAGWDAPRNEWEVTINGQTHRGRKIPDMAILPGVSWWANEMGCK